MYSAIQEHRLPRQRDLSARNRQSDCVIKPENLSFSVVGVSVIFLLSKNVEWHDLVSNEILHDM